MSNITKRIIKILVFGQPIGMRIILKRFKSMQKMILKVEMKPA